MFATAKNAGAADVRIGGVEFLPGFELLRLPFIEQRFASLAERLNHQQNADAR